MKHCLILLAFSMVVASSSVSQVPQTFSYQGLLTTSGGTLVPDGPYDLAFKLYTTASGGTPLWTELRTGVPVSKGTFSVVLGSVTPLAGVNLNQQLYLGVTKGTDPEFSPRSMLTSTPSSLAPWSVSGSDISYSSGNVGIGTATPAGKFHVNGDAFVGPMTAPDFGPDGGNLFITNTSGDPHNSFRLDGYSNGLYIVARSGASAIAGTGIYFCTAPTQGGEPARMFISPVGFVGIGTTTPSYRLDVAGGINALAEVRSNGVILTSDVRFKKDITPLTDALSSLEAIRGVSYYWKADEFPQRNFSTEKQIGFVAQELEKVFPELVSAGADGYKGVDYARLTPVLVEAIKELDSKTEKLTARLSELEAMVKSLVGERQKAGNSSIGGLK